MGPPGSHMYTPLNRSTYPYIEEGDFGDRFLVSRDLSEILLGGLKHMFGYISELLEGISEGLEDIQGYIRGYSGDRVSPVAFR